jgi:hypothetical protein
MPLPAVFFVLLNFHTYDFFTIGENLILSKIKPEAGKETPQKR